MHRLQCSACVAVMIVASVYAVGLQAQAVFPQLPTA
jgi:hypothetical protein